MCLRLSPRHHTHTKSNILKSEKLFSNKFIQNFHFRHERERGGKLMIIDLMCAMIWEFCIEINSPHRDSRANIVSENEPTKMNSRACIASIWFKIAQKRPKFCTKTYYQYSSVFSYIYLPFFFKLILSVFCLISLKRDVYLGTWRKISHFYSTESER